MRPFQPGEGDIWSLSRPSAEVPVQNERLCDEKEEGEQ